MSELADTTERVHELYERMKVVGQGLGHEPQPPKRSYTPLLVGLTLLVAGGTIYVLSKKD
jgi:hypothetical protein